MSLKRLTRQEINTKFLSDFVKKWEIVLKRILEITKGIMLRGLKCLASPKVIHVT